MHSKRLDKIELELAGLRDAPRGRKPGEFERLARKLGRYKVNRGKEPTYASPTVPNLGSPLSIPHHPTLKTGTALNIVNILQNDVDLWRQHLDQNEASEFDASGGANADDDADVG
jgi:hypothetical protein